MRGCSSISFKHRSCEPSTENAKSGQVLVRTRGGEKGRQSWLRTRRCRAMRGCSSISSNSGAANPQRKTQKSGQVLVRTREDKTESIHYFPGGMSGALKLGHSTRPSMAGRSSARSGCAFRLYHRDALICIFDDDCNGRTRIFRLPVHRQRTDSEPESGWKRSVD
jgi:hypothetical protein